MKSRSLKPAFVVTTSLAAACASDASTTTPITTSFEGLRPRQGATSTAERRETAAAREGNAVSLHPKDREGRTVFVSNNNHCFVEVPREGKPPPRTDGWVVPSFVDCPPVFDDPAWDALRSGWELKMDEKSRQCFFEPVRGNPPPADARANCPASAAVPAVSSSADEAQDK
jgi:hypothetical protein